MSLLRVLGMKTFNEHRAVRNRTHFWQATVDDFFGRSVILVVRQESGSTPVLMDSWNKLVKTADSSLANSPQLRYLDVRV